MQNNLFKNFHVIQDQIITAEKNFGRKSGDISLIAVTKTRSADVIRQAYQLGQRKFAENYVQEALIKMQELKDLDIEWHFIGNIQSNKTKEIAENFSWAQSVASEKIAKRLHEQRPENLPPLNICIEINMDNEVQKSGVSTQELPALIQSIQTLNKLKLRGFMIIPQEEKDILEQKKKFAKMSQLFEEYRQKCFDFDTLSMGMSNDYLAAIEEGSTMIRIGTALFGERKK